MLRSGWVLWRDIRAQGEADRGDEDSRAFDFYTRLW